MIVFGNNYCNEVNNDLKEVIIDKLYTTINVSKYRYNILYQKELDFLKQNKHHITLNNFGLKYFVMFMTYKNKKYCFYIDKRTLKYDKALININNVSIYSVKHCVSENFYNYTLFDGDMLKNMYDHYIFIICDVYYLYNKSYIEIPIEKKLHLIEEELNNKYKFNNHIEPCSFRVNKLYTYSDIQRLIKTTIPSLDYLACGLVFYPLFSGLRVIYKFNRDEMPNHIIYNSNKKNKNIDNRENVVDNSNKSHSTKKNNDNIMKYNENNTRTLDNLKNIKTDSKTLNFIIEDTEFPDVYNLYLKNDKNENKYSGIAYIPTISHSRFVLSLFKNNINNNTIIVKCKYAIDYKKWIPVNCVTNFNVDNYNVLENFD